MTDLDKAQAAVEAGDGAARLAFFRLLADTPLLLLLEREAEAEVLEPRIFDLDEGQVVLAFDSEERMAAMGGAAVDGGPMPYAELPGRVLALLLAGEGLSLGLNLGSGSPSEMLLPVSAMQWLASMLQPQGDGHIEDFGELTAPGLGLVATVQGLLTQAPARWGGLASKVRIFGRGQGGLILIEGADPDAEVALATALTEALRFSDLGGQIVDLAFANGQVLADEGVTVLWPEACRAPLTEPHTPQAPGMDRSKPPILR
jgi:hypothetical protein